MYVCMLAKFHENVHHDWRPVLAVHLLLVNCIQQMSQKLGAVLLDTWHKPRRPWLLYEVLRRICWPLNHTTNAVHNNVFIAWLAKTKRSLCVKNWWKYYECVISRPPGHHTHPFNSPLSRTTRVSRYQKGKTNLDFTEARDSEWQWHQLGHMQVCTSLQTNNHASTPPQFFTGRMPFLPHNQQRRSTERRSSCRAEISKSHNKRCAQNKLGGNTLSWISSNTKRLHNYKLVTEYLCQACTNNATRGPQDGCQWQKK